jgi:hypothetical protein
MASELLVLACAPSLSLLIGDVAPRWRPMPNEEPSPTPLSNETDGSSSLLPLVWVRAPPARMSKNEKEPTGLPLLVLIAAGGAAAAAASRCVTGSALTFCPLGVRNGLRPRVAPPMLVWDFE